MHLVAFHRAQAELMETPPALPADCRPDLAAIRPLLSYARQEGREWLTEPGGQGSAQRLRYPGDPHPRCHLTRGGGALRPRRSAPQWPSSCSPRYPA